MIKEEEEEKITSMSICDIMPTLANTVLPMARYETVRIQLRRRVPANAGVTDRIRIDTLFRKSDPLRKEYTASKKWPIKASALSGLDAEIYRRVIARQTGRHEKYDYKRDILERIDLGLDPHTQKVIGKVTSTSRVAAFEDLLSFAADKPLMRASMGTDVLTGTAWTIAELDKVMRKKKMMTESIMAYLLRSYLGTPKYDRSVVIDPFVWSVVARHPSPFPKVWLAAEVFQYKIPAEALPLGTDASDEILLNQCGISLVLFVLNEPDSHWTLLVYPIREDHSKRKLYHYDSYGDPDAGLARIEKRTMLPHVRLVKGGLFDETIFDFDDAGFYKYFTNPTWEPGITGCQQTDWWSCGYISLGVLDILCRKTERDPDAMSNPTTATMDPLQQNDIPKYGRSRRGKEDLQKYVIDMLASVQAWVKVIGKPTVWQIQEPLGNYMNTEGGVKKKLKSSTTSSSVVSSESSLLGNAKFKTVVDSANPRQWIRTVSLESASSANKFW